MMGRQSGLGRGLGALIPPKPPAPAVRPAEVRAAVVEASAEAAVEASRPEGLEAVLSVAVDRIDPNPQQPRVHFDTEKLEELAASIAEHGVLQPIVVAPSGSGRYVLVAGERRLRASKLAGKETVPAIVRSVSDQQSLELALIENIQRQDLNPLEEAESYLRLQHEFNLTQEDVAKKVGKSRPQIANIIRLLHLPQAMQDALVAGRISMSHARTLLGLEDEDARERLFRRILEGLTVREAEEEVTIVKTGGKARRVPTDPNVVDLVTRLRSALSTKVAIKRTARGTGEIRVHFQDDEDLQGLVARLAPQAEEGIA